MMGEAEEGFVVTGECGFCAFSYFCLGGCCFLQDDVYCMLRKR